ALPAALKRPAIRRNRKDASKQRVREKCVSRERLFSRPIITNDQEEPDMLKRTKGLLALALAGALMTLSAAAGAQTVTVFHDKPFYQAGWDGLTATAKKSGIDLQFSAYATDQFQAYIQSSL